MNEKTNQTLDVMVIAPHPDDAELGMGGAILKMLSDGLAVGILDLTCLLYTSPSPRDRQKSRMPSSA